MSPASQHSTERRLTIPAALSRLSEVRRFADGVAADSGFDRAALQQIKLAVHEAAANAIEHGSPSMSDTVELRAREEKDALAVYVADAGEFGARSPSPSPMEDRGRGLIFMGLLMDDVQVRPRAGGTIVRLSRRLPE
jgi:anti-sigma regulatory factor (Ser/Thr protein kinase)